MAMVGRISRSRADRQTEPRSGTLTPPCDLLVHDLLEHSLDLIIPRCTRRRGIQLDVGGSQSPPGFADDMAGMQAGIVEHLDAWGRGPWQSPEESQEAIKVPGGLRREDLEALCAAVRPVGRHGVDPAAARALVVDLSRLWPAACLSRSDPERANRSASV
jgi:hypothetical protein